MQKYRFGTCLRPDAIASAGGIGWDYIELDLNDLRAMDERAYRAMLADMEKTGLYAEVVSGLLPDDVAILGNDVSARRIHEALEVSFDIAHSLGAEIALFDCPQARKVPADCDPAKAWRQLGNFVRMLQGYAAESGVKTALLPLRRSVADHMNTASEAAMISALLQLDRVGVAASTYNMAFESESLQQLSRTGSLLWHVRTSNALGNRMPKAGDGEDYASLFEALRAMGYSGRVSCEAPYDASAAREALACLRAAAGQVVTDRE